MQKARNEARANIHEFFRKKDYLEVETPIGVLSPGTEIYLDYFKTNWIDFKNESLPLWLRSSPEIHMKQLLSQPGYDRIFQIAPCFRNGGELALWHHPEFMMLEWYEKEISYQNFMHLTENLIDNVLNLFKNSLAKESFTRITLTEAFKEFCGIELLDQDPDLSKKAKSQKIISVQDSDDFDTAFFKILIEKIEPKFKELKKVVLFDYLPSQAALAKVEDGFAKRFETYIDGIELSNGYLELLDPAENLNRIKYSNHQRMNIGKEIMEIDYDFLESLNYISENCCGNALGFDRLLAISIGQVGLDQIVPFRESMPYKKKRPDY